MPPFVRSAPLRSLRQFARSSARPGSLRRCSAALLVAACAEGASSAGTSNAGAQPAPAASVDTVRRPRIDSAAAAARATVMDTTGGREAARASAPPSPSDSAAARIRHIGSRAGDRHFAFRGTGSEADTLWPVKNAPAPLPGSLLPAKRIVAFYGNPLSKRMGILGEFPPDVMLRKLDDEVAAWNAVDPAHPVQPALHVIVEVADPTPGTSGKYRTRHDSATIEKVYGWARSRDAVMFVDLQVGQSTLQHELPWIEKFLVRPDVHLAIDPEFSMKKGGIPGRRVGTYDAEDINYATRYLADLVDRYHLPPKILVVHRFTAPGVTNYRNIKLDPRVQIVMHMDGFGPPWMKRDTYWRDIKSEPVEFAGWKQFTKLRNDKPPTPRGEILRLWPAPLYIQLQ